MSAYRAEGGRSLWLILRRIFTEGSSVRQGQTLINRPPHQAPPARPPPIAGARAGRRRAGAAERYRPLAEMRQREAGLQQTPLLRSARRGSTPNACASPARNSAPRVPADHGRSPYQLYRRRMVNAGTG